MAGVERAVAARIGRRRRGRCSARDRSLDGVLDAGIHRAVHAERFGEHHQVIEQRARRPSASQSATGGATIASPTVTLLIQVRPCRWRFR